MMIIFLSVVIDALNSGYEGRFRTLDGIELRCEECYIGSNVVVVPIVGDESLAMRFYAKAKPYLREIYGGGYHAKEFCVGGEYLDVVVTRWVDGVTLAEGVAAAVQQRDSAQTLCDLSSRFDQLAYRIVESNWAHGDLCCENIIITPDEELELIDNDSNYVAELAGCSSGELGHPAYQSPRRDVSHFHSRIDDFSIAILSVSLAALSIDPTLSRRFKSLDSLLLDGSDLGRDGCLESVVEVLKSGCKVAHLAMVRELVKTPVVIDCLPDLLHFICFGAEVGSGVEPFEQGGYWGYRDGGSVVIPPMFDMACDFDGDEAIVLVDRMWYKLDRKGSIRGYKL